MLPRDKSFVNCQKPGDHRQMTQETNKTYFQICPCNSYSHFSFSFVCVNHHISRFPFPANTDQHSIFMGFLNMGTRDILSEILQEELSCVLQDVSHFYPLDANRTHTYPLVLKVKNVSKYHPKFPRRANANFSENTDLSASIQLLHINVCNRYKNVNSNYPLT